MNLLKLASVALLAGCSGQAFSSVDYHPGGSTWQDVSTDAGDTTSDAETGGRSTLPPGSVSTAGTVGASNSSATGGTSSAPSSGIGQALATGGTTAKWQPSERCPCNELQCSPKSDACNSDTTKLGKVTATLTCIASEFRCTETGFTVYCYECAQ
jgi:hypothetical protein